MLVEKKEFKNDTNELKNKLKYLNMNRIKTLNKIEAINIFLFPLM
jgi:hypothetical protein